ncbi:MAG TPA: alpha/beta hydrolase fold domain-containing protein [Novosphingobium sp.]|nr:alpha/beta hydrolase fold domain-containing protein [Novosphingobium sp.]
MSKLATTRRAVIAGWVAFAAILNARIAFAGAKPHPANIGGETATTADKGFKGTFLGDRWIPSPKLASPEAQAFLQTLAGPDGRRPPLPQNYPPASDHAGWAALKRQVDAGIAASFADETARLHARLETVEMAGVKVQLATPEGGSQRPDCVYLDVHGGALIYGEGEFCRFSARKQADNLKVKVYGVDYRNPPEHPYPAALDDCVAVYGELLKRYPATNIIIGGGSAGGNLAAATILRARDEGLPLPAAAVLMTPEADLTESGDSFAVTDGLDLTYPNGLMPINLLYANGHDLRHPYLSPLFGDFTKGFPPTFLQAGTRDFFLSNTVLMHRALRRAGIQAELHVFEAMPHGGFHGAPEDLELAAEVARFVGEHWPAGK